MDKSEKLFNEKFVKAEDGSGKLFDISYDTENQPVVCLGKEFSNEELRREYFTDLLREKLKDPEFRKIEGFPIGEDEDILALSDPPYYTACPNPWISDFIDEWEKGKPQMNTDEHGLEIPYHREPFAADVSEGKNDPIYNAHSYHTKVPHKAIMRYILHYTEPGDIVFDGFCGTGMTGVAAQMCGDRATVESLGYKVEKDGTILQKEENKDGKTEWKSFSKLGTRKAVLNDLSPAATFIAYNYNTPVDVKAFEKEAKRILDEVEEKCGWMYETLHVEPASSRQITNIGFIPVNPFEVKDTIYRHDHLPHIQTGGATYFITFRTDNFRILSEEARKIVMDSIKFWDEKKLKLISSVVMPDHVHLIARPLIKTGENYWDISDILHSVKSFSANAINKTEGKKGVKVWQTESYDRVVRDEKELANELAYLNDNPVKAKIVKDADDYPYRYVVQELKAAGWKPALRRKINYTVWSDVFICPECTGEVIFWEAAVDKEKGKVNDIFPCPHCHSELTKRKMDRAWTNKYDFALKESIKQAKQVPVLINYSIGKSRFEKTPDAFDLELIDKIENTEIPFWFPHDRMMEGKETRRNDKFGITHIHHFYTQRNLYIISNYLHKINSIKDSNIRKIIHLTFNSVHQRHCKMNSFRFNVSFPSNIRSGTLYISSMTKENNFFDQISNKSFRRFLPVLKIINFFKHQCVQTGSASLLKSTPNSVDYLFVDPPFGSNLNYSELSFLWEEWLKVITNNEEEAIENTVQSKGSSEYRQLMISCFKEAYRVLKPGRWMTVEFSNTKANVWNSIQTALTEAGFIVANVSALDKGGTSIMALTTSTAVKQDLVISAYKPNGGFEERFEKEIETEEGIWDFIRTHLKYLPVVKKVGFDLVSIPERDPRILYDQLIAYYVRKGYPVPINSADFQLGLAQRFIPRGGMYFLPEQAAEYDRKKILSGAETVEQFFAGFVDDEASAINWLRFLLKEKPQTFQDINPQFMKVIAGWKRTETPLELSQLLEDNFYCYDGKGPVPNQIHGYLSTNWKEMRNLEKDDPILKEKAKNRWCIPDPKDIAQIEQMRERRLLKEFEAYKGRKGKFKRSETFRLEAVRAGFKKAWQDRDYQTIINVAEKIPNNILEEDPKLLMWYDQAQTRLGD